MNKQEVERWKKDSQILDEVYCILEPLLLYINDPVTSWLDVPIQVTQEVRENPMIAVSVYLEDVIDLIHTGRNIKI